MWAVLHCGLFGMAEETGRDINRALREGVARGIGFGEAVGQFILDNGNPHKDWSLLALCRENDIPVTVHVAIGTDIVHQHPTADGAVIGQASYTDFRIFASVISELGDGGVYLNVGSAVLLPGVLKALSIVRTSDTMWIISHGELRHAATYRPLQNVVKRPTSGKQGAIVTGHHEIMLPLLAAGILDPIRTSTAAGENKGSTHGSQDAESLFMRVRSPVPWWLVI
jgi:hypothetical protein